MKITDFEEKGRGVPYKGHVLISTGGDDKIITEKVWRNRLEKTCKHGFMGWTCKRCL